MVYGPSRPLLGGIYVTTDLSVEHASRTGCLHPIVAVVLEGCPDLLVRFVTEQQGPCEEQSSIRLWILAGHPFLSAD